ncbi:NAD-dependent epimerase/dehydratase family protein [Spirulina sp. CS-785/01]|uniref:NAD-dependent epimerase/dehydratase family protein n=1 Tax=Spirulina sp. CS-785/01 TaxID=3021716 RepID=UPI003FA7D809
MKALVTGANGFTGSHLVKGLEKRGFEVVGLVRQSSNLQRLTGTGVKLVYGDICDRNTLKTALTDVDIVFHTAASVELGIVDATEMERVNVKGTKAVLEVAQDTFTNPSPLGWNRMVYCSTIGIYGDTQGQVVDETYQRQQKTFSSAYDQTKYEAQQLVDAAAKNGFPVVSVMPSGIFGTDDPHFAPVIRLYLQKKLPFWLGSDRIMGIVHVDDLVSGMLLAAEKSPPGEHYILSAPELPIKDLFALLDEKTGLGKPTEVPKFLVYGLTGLIEPIGHLFSWNPPLSLERLHYIYERCVRIQAQKAQNQLGWQPRTAQAILTDFLDKEQ